jgi:pimeloyl-ACP methyl ester carboxylesterase
MSTDSWNKLTGKMVYPPGGKLGGKVWDPVVPLLEAGHHTVFAPTLRDEYHFNLTDHIGQVCALIAEHRLGKPVLVAHSYGGMVITGVADRLAGAIQRLVFVDAALPDPGQSLFDIIASGGRDPLSFAGLEALPPYVERLSFDPAIIIRLPKTYILCTQSDFAVVTRSAKKKIADDTLGWQYLELPTSHAPMATMNDRLVAILLEAAEK